ncbi:hypothetical protein [Methanobrevibacter sp.]|uniref:hypothetical protein n=1 Tax=Methanobrevibacter sp. TaxID=66852 RepID=UPI00388D1F22
MNFKKILGIGLILVTLCVGLSVVSASLAPINMGDITHSNLDITSYDQSTGNLKFTSDIDVDISALSAQDKDSLKKAIEDKNTTHILNMTCGNSIKITLWTYDGVADAKIDGDTLHIKNTKQNYKLTGGSPDDLKITGVAFNTTAGQLFVAEN